MTWYIKKGILQPHLRAFREWGCFCAADYVQVASRRFFYKGHNSADFIETFSLTYPLVVAEQAQLASLSLAERCSLAETTFFFRGICEDDTSSKHTYSIVG